MSYMFVETSPGKSNLVANLVSESPDLKMVKEYPDFDLVRVKGPNRGVIKTRLSGRQHVVDILTPGQARTCILTRVENEAHTRRR